MFYVVLWGGAPVVTSLHCVETAATKYLYVRLTASDWVQIKKLFAIIFMFFLPSHIILPSCEIVSFFLVVILLSCRCNCAFKINLIGILLSNVNGPRKGQRMNQPKWLGSWVAWPAFFHGSIEVQQEEEEIRKKDIPRVLKMEGWKPPEMLCFFRFFCVAKCLVSWP